MASYHSASTSSRGGSRTEQLLAHTRKGASCIAGERITGETQLSYASSQNQPHSYASTQHEDVDEDEQDQEDLQTGAQTTAEGQPKKKKTRRAGVAITRVRRMQREVRRLAEEEEATAPRQPQPVRSLLLGAQPASPISPTATSPTARQFQGLPFTGAASPPPRGFKSPVGSLARTSTERQPRSETPQAGPAAHPRGPAYDRILEEGDDVVLLRLPGAARAPGSSIWTYRPEERPRGGPA
ncbi:hypothetical protein C8T65DRAFT_666225 [Cerioporus squamosus]|nr:hypothetical protein C8T65DRAFT_666225 [Cerioporus squamosus]